MVLRKEQPCGIILSVLGSFFVRCTKGVQNSMGKNLKGRECGKGIYQRKDGKYSARYYAKNGKRHERYFDTLPEARNWLADAVYEEKYGIVVANTDMTVDEMVQILDRKPYL